MIYCIFQVLITTVGYDSFFFNFKLMYKIRTTAKSVYFRFQGNSRFWRDVINVHMIKSFSLKCYDADVIQNYRVQRIKVTFLSVIISRNMLHSFTCLKMLELILYEGEIKCFLSTLITLLVRLPKQKITRKNKQLHKQVDISKRRTTHPPSLMSAHIAVTTREALN